MSGPDTTTKHVTPPRRGRNRASSRALRKCVGANVRRLRKERELTQEQFGRLCGISKNHVSNVECGRLNLTLATLETLARGLNCCETDLLRAIPSRAAS